MSAAGSDERAAAEAELDRQLAELEQKAAALEARQPKAPQSPFWLSHHPPDEYARTFRIGSVHVCARCLGTYPVLFAAIAVQLALNARLSWRFDGPWSIALLLPALTDWSFGRFRPHAGSNLIRTGSGILLGLALGRTLYIHLRAPWPSWLWIQAGLVTAVAVFVIVARWLRKSR